MRKYRNKKKNRKSLYYTLGSLILVILVIALFYRGQVLNFSTFFHDIGSHVTGIFVPKRVNYQNITSLREESLKAENKKFQELLDLKSTMSGYELIFTTVVDRNLEYWFQSLTLDKGSTDGIEKDMVVINEKGLVGRVIDVHRHSSIVKLITASDNENKISVSIVGKNESYNGIISGYESSKNQILVTSIRSTSSIEVGDQVKTNGLGTLFPDGIVIGTVERISSDDLGVSKVLGVKSDVNFEDIKYLAVLKRGNL